jgi:hypothetical protein
MDAVGLQSGLYSVVIPIRNQQQNYMLPSIFRHTNCIPSVSRVLIPLANRAYPR